MAETHREEGSVIRKLCTHLNGWQERLCDFLPESGEGGLSGETAGRGLPCASVSAITGPIRMREYVNGGYIGQLPFRVAIRITGAVPADRLEVLEFFDRLTAYLEKYVPSPDSLREYLRCRMTALPVKDSVSRDGAEEYAARYMVEYRRYGEEA